MSFKVFILLDFRILLLYVLYLFMLYSCYTRMLQSSLYIIFHRITHSIYNVRLPVTHVQLCKVTRQQSRHCGYCRETTVSH